MSNIEKIKSRVYLLERELRFWENVHRNEAPDETEFKLQDQIRQLKNCDEFGMPRYNGKLDIEDNEVYNVSYRLSTVICKYCERSDLQWKRVNGKWRLFEFDKQHKCGE